LDQARKEQRARILVVDRDEEFGRWISRFLEDVGFSCEAAPTGLQAIGRLEEADWDCILLDLLLSDMDGFALLRRIREKGQTSVVVLSARADAASRIGALEEGADDFLAKPFDRHELAARIRAILRRLGKQQASRLLEAGGIRLDPKSRKVTNGGRAQQLTSVEFDILQLLMASAGSPVSRDAIMQRMCQRDYSPLDRSIDVHISHLRRKLDTSGTLIRTVRGVGYQFVDSDVEMPRPVWTPLSPLSPGPSDSPPPGLKLPNAT
jgi:two-component system, OmpR family, response regulator CpxR